MPRFDSARTCVLVAAMTLVPGACADGAETPDAPPATVTTTAEGATTSASTSAAAATTATTEAVRVVEVTYAGGQVTGGPQRTTVRLGEKVRIRVTSDVEDEVHVHTYDVRAAVSPAQPAVLDVLASIPGRHEVELEKKRRQLLVLEVR